MSRIKSVFARQILNSKAIPTVEVTVAADDGSWASASCPTGTSLSHFEAKEVRDNIPSQFNGLGVTKAVENIVQIVSPKIMGMDVTDQSLVDKTLNELDGTPDKSKLGVNSILPVSIAVAKVAAHSLKKPLFLYIRHLLRNDDLPHAIPTPLFNILNGGLHAGDHNLDFQEFLISPASSLDFEESLNIAVTIYVSLKKTLEMNSASTLVGDEGGFGPTFPTNHDAFSILKQAIDLTTYKLNYDVFLGIDAAANSFYDEKKYKIKDKPSPLSSDELISYYNSLVNEFSLLYLEDPLADEDIDNWGKIGPAISGKTIIVGDDLTATNPLRLQTAIQKKAISGIIIKPNQIGTVSEALAVVEMARLSGLKIIVSHRSGETNDDFIADFAVGAGADFAKFGAPARGERVAKYNRLLAIEKQIKYLSNQH